MRPGLSFLLAVVTVVLGAALPAQGKVELKFVVADKYERAVTTDAQGLQQWAEWKHENCPTCKGSKTTVCPHCDRLEGVVKCPECGMKKTAPCRACGGLGYWPDPLEKVTCPGCMGAGMFPCDVCAGLGHQKVTGGGDKPKDCVACRGDGGYKCTVCNGVRLVEVVKLKPSVGEASLDNLQKARDAVEAVLKAVAAFQPTGKATRKEIKEYEKLLQPATTVLPPLKRCQGACEEVMKNILRGEVWVGHEEREAAALNRWKSVNDYYLAHQKRLLDLCIARAEANDKAAGGKKGG